MALPVDPHAYGLFLSGMAVMAVTPGPANVFAVATGMERGKRKVLVAVAGMNGATLCWFGAAALGLGALVAAFPAQFRLIAVAGGLYVGWLGLTSILGAVRDDGRIAAHAPKRSASSTWAGAFRDGFAVQIANPKAVVFFAGFLPGFLDPQRPIVPQMLLFALGTIGFDVIAMSAYGLGGAALSARLTEPRFRRLFGLFVGALLLVTATLILARGH